MRITEVRATIVSVPYKAPDVWSHGRNQGLTSIIVEVETDEGPTGIGEANGDRSAAAVVTVLAAARPLLVGQDPSNIERIARDFYVRGKWHNVRPFAHQALAGLEMALWDIVGQACRQPLHRLMGGLLHPRINFFYYLFPFPFPCTARGARRWFARRWSPTAATRATSTSGGTGLRCHSCGGVSRRV